MHIYNISDFSTSVNGSNGDAFINCIMEFYDNCEDHITLDFSKVEFLSSIALAAVERLHTKMAEDGKKLTITNLSANIYQLFEITGLVDIVKISSANKPDGQHSIR